MVSSWWIKLTLRSARLALARRSVPSGSTLCTIRRTAPRKSRGCFFFSRRARIWSTWRACSSESGAVSSATALASYSFSSPRPIAACVCGSRVSRAWARASWLRRYFSDMRISSAASAAPPLLSR